MVKKTHFLLLSVLLLSASLCSAARADSKTLVDDVRVKAHVVDLAQNETLELSWTMAEPCTYSVQISDMQGNIVKTLADNETAAQPGAVALTWDGLNDDGLTSPENIYFPIIQARSKWMGSFTYNPTALPWGQQADVEPYYDPNQQRVFFTLDQRFYGRLLVGNPDGGPIYTIIAPWRIFAATAHEIAWNGMDSNSVAQVIDLAGVAIFLDGYTLPENSFMIVGSNPKGKNGQGAGKPASKKASVLPPSGPTVSPYSLFSTSFLPDPEIAITLKGGQYKNDAVPTVKGTVSFGVDVADKSGVPMSLTKEKMEVAIYIDTQLNTETYLYKLPAKLDVDTTKLTNGEHYITINVRTPDYRVGLFSGKLMIAN